MFVHQAKRAWGRAGLIALPLVTLAVLVFGALPASAHPTTRAVSQASVSGAGVSCPIDVDGFWPGYMANCDGRGEMFRVAGNGSVEYKYQILVNGAWTDWIGMGGTLLYGSLSV